MPPPEKYTNEIGSQPTTCQVHTRYTFHDSRRKKPDKYYAMKRGRYLLQGQNNTKITVVAGTKQHARQLLFRGRKKTRRGSRSPHEAGGESNKGANKKNEEKKERTTASHYNSSSSTDQFCPTQSRLTAFSVFSRSRTSRYVPQNCTRGLVRGTN